MKKIIVEEKLNIPGDYQFKAMRTKFFPQANWHANKLEAIKKFIDINKNAVILDVGVGSGNFELKYAKDVKKIYCIDYHSKPLNFLKKQTKELNINNVETQLLDIKELNKFKKTDVNYIIMIDVIEHLDKKLIQIMLNEYARILKKGGKVCIVTPNYSSLWPIIENLSDKFKLLPQFSGEQHVTKFDAVSLNEIFNTKDWKHVKTGNFNQLSFLAPTKFLSSFLCGIELNIPFNTGSLLISTFEKK